MSDEKIMDDYIRECWKQDPDQLTAEEKAAVKGTIDFESYKLQKQIEEATQPLLVKMKKCDECWYKVLNNFKVKISTARNKQRLWNEIMAVTGASTEEMKLLDSKAKEIADNQKITYLEALEGFMVMALRGYKIKDLLDHKVYKSAFKAMGFDW